MRTHQNRQAVFLPLACLVRSCWIFRNSFFESIEMLLSPYNPSFKLCWFITSEFYISFKYLNSVLNCNTERLFVTMNIFLTITPIQISSKILTHVLFFRFHLIRGKKLSVAYLKFFERKYAGISAITIRSLTARLFSIGLADWLVKYKITMPYWPFSIVHRMSSMLCFA